MNYVYVAVVAFAAGVIVTHLYWTRAVVALKDDLASAVAAARRRF